MHCSAGVYISTLSVPMRDCKLCVGEQILVLVRCILY